MIDHHLLQFLEVLGVMLGGALAFLRFWPQLRQIAIVVQLAFFLTQIFSAYIKANPEKGKKIKIMFSQMIDHYLRTHPHGRAIAEETNANERVKFLFFKKRGPKPNASRDFYRLLGIKVDSK